MKAMTQNFTSSPVQKDRMFCVVATRAMSGPAQGQRALLMARATTSQPSASMMAAITRRRERR